MSTYNKDLMNAMNRIAMNLRVLTLPYMQQYCMLMDIVVNPMLFQQVVSHRNIQMLWKIKHILNHDCKKTKDGELDFGFYAEHHVTRYLKQMHNKMRKQGWSEKAMDKYLKYGITDEEAIYSLRKNGIPSAF